MGRRTVEDTATKVRRFNDWIRGELKRQKKNQTELAYYIGTDQSGLSLRMNEKRTWTLKEYFNVLEFFGKSAEDAEW
jgi:hypothetical protein